MAPQLNRYLNESPAELSLTSRTEAKKGLIQSPVIYPELDREILYKLSTQDLPPPTPASLIFSGSSSQLSASPSTKFSGSPGPGPYSRDTTPTSISSQSPGLTSSVKFNPPKGRQLSPALTRPPVTRRRTGSFPNEVDAISADPHGLAAVRESLTSSSSSSTVKDVDRNMKDRKPARHLPPPPPSPPPRKSSQKFRKNSDGETKKSPAPSINSKARLTPTSASPQKTSAPSLPTLVPRRPSRDGAPDIRSQLIAPAPVVHSNLSSTSLPNERRGSESNDLAPSHRRARNASTSQVPVVKDVPVVAKSSSSKSLRAPDSAAPSPAPSPSVGSSFRFPFFGRKKATPENPSKAKKEPKEKQQKPTRKGPAAGTGHEGYGRIGGVRRRSGSSNLSRGFADLQASQESLVSSDHFFADRMNPVVIAGGEIVENRNTSADLTRTESNQSLLSRPSIDSKGGGSMTPGVGSRTTMWPSPAPTGPNTAASSRRPSDSRDSGGIGMTSMLALRRSVRHQGASENPIRLPHPINTNGVASSPMTSFDTSVMSDESHLEMQREISRGRNAVHTTPKKLTKRDRSPRKWTLFGKSQKRTAPKIDDTATVPVLSVETKPVAFYTMIDPSEQDLAQEVDIKDVLRSADVYSESPRQGTPGPPFPGRQTPDLHQPAMRESPQTARKIYLGPSPMSLPSESKPQVYPPPANATLRSGRPSRLQQVGRIPKVVSNRQEEASPKSFSRPFRASMQLPPQPAEYIDPQSVAKGPSPPNASSSVPDLTTGESTGESTNVSWCDPRVNVPVAIAGDQDQKEFLRFSPRKNSDVTVGTSSSSGMFPYNSATAVIPGPDDPPAEDEVWDEYDDLFDDGNTKPPPSATSSSGTPFHLETYESKLAKEKIMESPTLAADRVMSAHSLVPTASSCYSADMTERIRNAFQPHPSPTSPPVTQDAEQSQDRSSEEGDLSRATALAPKRSLSPIKERDSDSSCCSSDDGSPLSLVNLRVGSMTVSKWLTFGHVLFSDVRHELIAEEGSLKRPSILVIDGLGNDDWSFYAAETYPAATFYNLSPRAPLPTDTPSSPSSFPLTPPNHHQIQFVSHMQKFPFAPQSFTSVVYRFPVAAPESHYRNILSEARRVLKPGGYLELSILDVDLNNMGTHGRRAVRQLKENIHMANPDISLASTADLIVRLIGKAGFYDVKAARVGVPVASPIARSHSGIRAEGQKAGVRITRPSLSEMMSDDSATADESITKMVARVGRWWYTRCYENATEPDTLATIWGHKAVVRECEELGTSLKLMVCCGRAPDRVSSV
ncbi:hypothetical protein ACO1O0_003490 [Amphichorda felina]